MFNQSWGTGEILMPQLKVGERINGVIVVKPEKLGSPGEANVYVKVRIALGYHIGGLEKEAKSSLEETRLEMKLPDGLTLQHDWQGPKTEKLNDGSSGYRKDVVFQNRLQVEPGVAPGKLKIQIKIFFQVCNEALCWPPEEISREIELEVGNGMEGK
jgi:hypothetical protein